MTSTTETTPHPLDIALGATVRIRRKAIGFSQDSLARQVGITFQQVQKYEHGTNRISFSRLVEIAEALECEAVDLVAEVTKQKAGKPGKTLALLAEPGAVDLLEAYGKISSPKRRRSILNLARQLASDEE